MQNLDAFLESNMPPLVSDPGCDNGLMPYEPEEVIASVNAGLNGDLEILRMNFLNDMLGTGPMPSDWGMLNMMLSDTMGNPLTAHMMNVAFKRLGYQVTVLSDSNTLRPFETFSQPATGSSRWHETASFQLHT